MSRVLASLLALALGLTCLVPSAGAAPSGTLTPVAMIPIPGLPLNLADPRGTGLSTDFIRFDPSSNLLYLTDGANKAIDVFDAGSRRMVDRITVADAPHDAIVDPALGVVVASLSNKSVVTINLANGTQASVNVGGASIADLAGYDPATKTYAVGSKGTPPQLSFLHIDPAGSTLLGQLPLTLSPEEPKFFNGKFYLSVPNNILVVDPATRSVTTTWTIPGCSGHGFALGPGGEAYLGCTSGGVIVNLNTGAIVTQFTGSQIGDTDLPAYDAKNNRYYAPGHITVSGASVAVLGVIDAASHQLVGTLSIDPGSETQAAVDATGTVYIATGPQVGGACLSACLFVYQPSAPSGRNFKVTSNGMGSVGLSWEGGLGQASLTLVRVAGGVKTLLPAPAAGATSATDTLPAGTNSACYQLLALNAASVMVRQSDLECVITNLANPIPATAPMPIGIMLNQGSNATVSWRAAPGATGYFLLQLPSGRTQVLSADQLTAADATNGAPACYVVLGRGVMGPVTSMSDAVCGFPGTSASATADRASVH